MEECTDACCQLHPRGFEWFPGTGSRNAWPYRPEVDRIRRYAPLSVPDYTVHSLLALAGNILAHLGLNPNNTAPSTEMTRQMLQNPTMFAALQSLRQQAMPVSSAAAPSTLSSGHASFASSASNIPAQPPSARPIMTSAIPGVYGAVKEEPKPLLSSTIGIASHAKVYCHITAYATRSLQAQSGSSVPSIYCQSNLRRGRITLSHILYQPFRACFTKP